MNEAIIGTPSRPSAASTVSQASFGIRGAIPLSRTMLRVCARSDTVVKTDAMRADAMPPVNSARTLPVIDSGVSAARPSAVTPPGTRAR